MILTLHEKRSAEAVKATVRDKVLFTHGRIDELRSDHAREFVGRAMTALSKEVGYLATTTGGYNASGNATMERFWGYLRVCLCSLSDIEYQHIEDHLQSMAFAWNTTVSDSLTVAPFHVMTGTEPRTIADGILAPDTSSTDPNEPIDIPAICASAAEYTRIARANADYMRKQNAETLNKNGRLLKPLAVGDCVKIYKPPGHAQAIKHDRKAKHLPCWAGPMQITKIEGTKYSMEYKYNTSQMYERHLCNIRKWNGPIPGTAPVTAAPDEMAGDIEVGTFLIACDKEGDTVLDLGKIIKIQESEVTIHCYGTRGKNVKTAKFRPMFASKTNVSFGKALKGMVPYTWKIDTEDFNELVPSCGIKLTKNGNLNSHSIKIFKGLRPKRTMRTY